MVSSTMYTWPAGVVWPLRQSRFLLDVNVGVLECTMKRLLFAAAYAA